MAVSRRAFAVLGGDRRVLLFLQRRNIMSSTFRAEKALEKLQTNPYYEKYSKKIAEFQKFVIHLKLGVLISACAGSRRLG
jgi:hypothetical protein